MKSKSWSQRLGDWILNNLPWLFIIIGILLLLIAYMIPFEGLSENVSSNNPDSDNVMSGDQHIIIDILKKVPDALKSMASAILGAGIFAAILKSFQFSGIFQKALANVIYNSEYLAKQDRPYVANPLGHCNGCVVYKPGSAN